MAAQPNKTKIKPYRTQNWSETPRFLVFESTWHLITSLCWVTWVSNKNRCVYVHLLWWVSHALNRCLEIKGVACIREVGCAHPEFAPYLVQIRCPKVRCVHPSKLSFWLRGSVPKKTPACKRFRNDSCVHPFPSQYKPILDPNFHFYYRIFALEDGPDRRHR